MPLTPEEQSREKQILDAYKRALELGGSELKKFLDQLGQEESDEVKLLLANSDSKEADTTEPSASREPHRDVDKADDLEDRYELFEEIGRGGMGVVYRARQKRPDRMVAVKVMRSQFLDALQPDKRRASIDRFRNEADAAGRIDHESIVAVHEVGDSKGNPWFSMRYVQGSSLAEQVRTGPIECKQAARYIEEIARAVDKAHRKGVLHRDLKPGNILIDAKTNRALVTDFGIAKLIEGNHDVTVTGDVFGSPPYMSPEQAEDSRNVTVASDVYSLGATLYHLITGEPPFLAEKVMETLRQVMEKEPQRPRGLNPEIPRDLDTICIKCLQKKPGDRYDSPADLADELGRYIRGEPITARPVSKLERTWRWCKRNPLVSSFATLAVVALLVTAIVSFVAYRRTATALHEKEVALEDTKLRLAERDTNRGLELCERGDVDRGLHYLTRGLANAPTDAEQLRQHIRLNLSAWWYGLNRLNVCVAQESPVVTIALSPDGSRLLTGGLKGKAYLWDVVSGEPIGPVLDHANQIVVCSAFSPDGRIAATGGYDGTVQLRDAVTGESIGDPLVHTEMVLAISFFPDSSKIVTAAGNAVGVWDMESGRPIGNSMLHNANVTCLAVSSDGSLIASASRDKTARLWNGATSESVGMPLQHGETVYAVAFDNAGSRLVTGCGDKRARVWSVPSGDPVGHPLVLTDTVSDVEFSPDGRLVLTASGDGTSQLWNSVNGERIGNAFLQRRYVREASFNPTGNRILTASDDGTVKLWDVATGQMLGQPMRHLGDVVSAAFSSDGSQIVASSADGRGRIWDVAEGFGQTLLRGLAGQVVAATFHPDGKNILLGLKSWRMRLLNLSTGEGLELPSRTPGAPRFLAISPDGNSIVLAGSGVGESLQVLHRKAGWQNQMTIPYDDYVSSLAVSADGKWMAASGRENTARVWNLDTGESILTVDLPANVASVSFSPTGPLLAALSDDGTIQVWDVDERRRVVVIASPKDVRVFSFSPDGATFVTGGQDHFARFWDVRTGDSIGHALAHEGPVNHVVVAPGGNVAATVSSEKQVRLWDIRLGKPIGPPMNHVAPVCGIAFWPDPKTVTTVGSDGTVKQIRIPERVTASPEQLEVWVQAITGMELHQEDNLVVLDTKEWRKRWRSAKSGNVAIRRKPSKFRSSQSATAGRLNQQGSNTSPDCELANVEIESLTANRVQLRYTIKNIGQSPKSLRNLTIQTYYSASRKFSDQDVLPAGGSVVEIRGRQLLPGESFNGEFTCSPRPDTRRSAYLIVKIFDKNRSTDSFVSVRLPE